MSAGAPARGRARRPGPDRGADRRRRHGRDRRAHGDGAAPDLAPRRPGRAQAPSIDRSLAAVGGEHETDAAHGEGAPGAGLRPRRARGRGAGGRRDPRVARSSIFSRASWSARGRRASGGTPPGSRSARSARRSGPAGSTRSRCWSGSTRAGSPGARATCGSRGATRIRPGSTSAVTCTSTHAPSGNDAIPTAARACRPSSPSTSDQQLAGAVRDLAGDPRSPPWRR